MKSPTKSDLEKLRHHSQIYFAVFCAEQVFHLVKQEYQPACRQAIELVKLSIKGKATKEECRVTTYVAAADAAAASSAVDADAAAAYDADDAAADANAANAAVYKAYDAYDAYDADAADAAAAAVYDAAAAAYAAAADAAAVAAADAAAAAVDAVSSKDKQTVIEAQWEYYKELLTFETIIEDVLLG